MPQEKEKVENQIFRLHLSIKTSRWLRITGIILVVMSVFLFLLIFFPVIKEEIKYQLFYRNKNALVESKEEMKHGNGNEKEKNVILPADEDFGIVIPKIFANAKVIPDVDAQNSAVYQRALMQGVAQAKGTAVPGEGGNIFIFAHSSADFYQANRYNAVFYLLSKLGKGDDIYLFYKKQKYSYRVTDKKIVGATEVNYLDNNSGNRLTLMTCWPPGTTMKRLIIISKPAGY